jgi:hypothetical protein
MDLGTRLLEQQLKKQLKKLLLLQQESLGYSLHQKLLEMYSLAGAKRRNICRQTLARC